MTLNAIDFTKHVSMLVQLVQSDTPLDNASDLIADVWGRDRSALAEAFHRVWTDDGRPMPARAGRIHNWLTGKTVGP